MIKVSNTAEVDNGIYWEESPNAFIERIPGFKSSERFRERDWEKIRRNRRELARQNLEAGRKSKQFQGREPDDPKKLTKKFANLLKEMRNVMPREIWVPRFLLKIARNANEAVILAYLVNWFDRGVDGRVKVKRFNGEHLYSTTIGDLAAELGFKERSVRTALRNLVKEGLITKRRNGRGLFLRPDLEAICGRLGHHGITSEPFESFVELCEWAINQQSDGTLVSAAMIGITGRADDVIILAQLLYYFGSDGMQFRARVKKHGLFWVAKSHSEVAKLLQCPRSRAIPCLRRLKSRGLVETLDSGFAGRRCLHLRPDYQGIVNSLFELQEELLCRK